MDTKGSLTGRTALVTGGASGIGAATCRALADAGAAVVLADIDPAGSRIADQLSGAGGRAAFHQVDVTSAAACAAMVDRCIAQFGTLDVAVNVVGAVDPPPEPDGLLSTDNWDRTIALSLSSMFYCIRAELTHMLAAGGGTIVNIASVGGLVSLPGKLAYVSAKHGVIGLTKAVCDSFADRNIRCNAVAPGLIATPGLEAARADGVASAVDQFARRIPAGRLGSADDVARAVLWLAAADASYINGAVLTVDGGYVAR